LHSKTRLPNTRVDIPTRRKFVVERRQLGGTHYIEPVRIHLPEVVSGVRHEEAIKADCVLPLGYFAFQGHGSSLRLRTTRLRRHSDQRTRRFGRFLLSGIRNGWLLCLARGTYFTLYLREFLFQLFEFVVQLLQIRSLRALGLRLSRLNPTG